MSTLSSPLTVCTFNANGLQTPLAAGTDTEIRAVQVVRFFRSAHVSVMGLQEPHLSDEGDFDKISKFFAARELAFTGSITGALRGGGGHYLPHQMEAP